MKNIQFSLPLIIISVILGGCPYKSAVPIETASRKIDKALLGKWEKKDSGNDVYIVSKKDDNTYKIEKKQTGSDKTETYSAHLSQVDGQSFLNLSPDAEADGYYLYKFTLNNSGNKITLQEVTENITEQFDKSTELKAFINKYQSLSFFFTKGEEVYFKAD